MTNHHYPTPSAAAQKLCDRDHFCLCTPGHQFYPDCGSRSEGKTCGAQARMIEAAIKRVSE